MWHLSKRSLNAGYITNLINSLATTNVPLTDSIPLPDSITEWGILAISASPHTGRRRDSSHCGSQFWELVMTSFTAFSKKKRGGGD